MYSVFVKNSRCGETFADEYLALIHYFKTEASLQWQHNGFSLLVKITHSTVFCPVVNHILN